MMHIQIPVAPPCVMNWNYHGLCKNKHVLPITLNDTITINSDISKLRCVLFSFLLGGAPTLGLNTGLGTSGLTGQTGGLGTGLGAGSIFGNTGTGTAPGGGYFTDVLKIRSLYVWNVQNFPLSISNAKIYYLMAQ